MRLFALSIAAVMAALLTGCDPVYGPQRTVTVAQLPPPTVVVAALHSTPGVRGVTQREVPAHTEWGLYDGTKHYPAFHQFAFSDGAAGGVIETKQDAQGINHLRLYSLWLHQRPPKAEFDRARALLDAAYLSLQRSVPSLPPPQAVKETFIGSPSQ